MVNPVLNIVEDEVQKLISAHGHEAVMAVFEKLKALAPPVVDTILDSVELKVEEVAVDAAHKLADKIDGEVG